LRTIKPNKISTIITNEPKFLDKPLIFLSIVWIFLVVLEFFISLPHSFILITYLIWGIFVFDFLLKLALSPDRLKYLKKNWLAGLSMIVPAIRILRIFRFTRLFRILTSIRSITFLNLFVVLRRGMFILRKTLGEYGFGYVVILTLIITLLGAAGMAYFESPSALKQSGYAGSDSLTSYMDALWWTAMMITTMGSGYWPKTAEGRILALLIAFYAFTFFSYITANIASRFISIKNKPK